MTARSLINSLFTLFNHGCGLLALMGSCFLIVVLSQMLRLVYYVLVPSKSQKAHIQSQIIEVSPDRPLVLLKRLST